MNARRAFSSMIRVPRLYGFTCAPKMCVYVWRRRATRVVTVAMPPLPPIFRIKLKILVALPIRSLGMGSIVAVVSGTNSSASEVPSMNWGQKTSQ